jgi:hypothetical protein
MQSPKDLTRVGLSKKTEGFEMLKQIVHRWIIPGCTELSVYSLWVEISALEYLIAVCLTVELPHLYWAIGANERLGRRNHIVDRRVVPGRSEMSKQTKESRDEGI